MASAPSRLRTGEEDGFQFRPSDLLTPRCGLTVLVRVVGAVHVSVAELVGGLAGELVQTGPAALGAALLWLAVGGVERHVVVGAPAAPPLWRGEAELLTATVVFCTPTPP